MASEAVKKLPALPTHLVVDAKSLGQTHHHLHLQQQQHHPQGLRGMLPKGTDLPGILTGYKPLMRARWVLMCFWVL